MSSHVGSFRGGTPNRAGTSRSAPPTNTNAAGIPVSNTHTPSPSESAASVSDSRKRQSKRDEAIRRKIESDLSKKKHTTSRARQTRKVAPGTVLALRPSQALQIKPTTTVAEAAQLMAAKREDCVLVTDDDDRISGIFTAKDLAFRVVGAGINARDFTIAQIMTKNPLCARTDTSATDALDLMVRKGFRHLPVMDENQDISGILDITKCFYEAMEKLERAYASSRKLYDALEGVQSELGSSQPQQIISYVEALRQKMSGPNLESVLDGNPPTVVSVRTTVRDAAVAMKENHTTAVLVQDNNNITGIFTSKDVVLRVIAPGLDPAVCSVVRVMTPHPDFAPMEMTIQSALRKMHDGHYLNLPVMNNEGEIVGMVDVLKLTYATLEQINSMSTTDSEGPAWNKFWLSLENDTESQISDHTGRGHTPSIRTHTTDSPNALRHSISIGHLDRHDNAIQPNDSASHVGDHSDRGSYVGESTANPIDHPFSFKFKAPSGRIHRVQSAPSGGVVELVGYVSEKLGSEILEVGGNPEFGSDGKLSSAGFALSYVDDEGDIVSITSDGDLVDAVNLARRSGKDKVDLFVHDPAKPAVVANVDSQPPIVTRRKPKIEIEAASGEDEEYEEERRSKKNSYAAPPEPAAPLQAELIPGVPNELILPGAIVTLAVAIVGVFALSRR